MKGTSFHEVATKVINRHTWQIKYSMYQVLRRVGYNVHLEKICSNVSDISDLHFPFGVSTKVMRLWSTGTYSFKTSNITTICRTTFVYLQNPCSYDTMWYNAITQHYCSQVTAEAASWPIHVDKQNSIGTTIAARRILGFGIWAFGSSKMNI